MTSNSTGRSVSVLITTFNSAATIGPCLESIRDFTHVLIIDSGSTDATLNIASEYGRMTVHRDFVSSPEQVNWGLDQLAGADWVLILDSDEAIEFSYHRLLGEICLMETQGFDAIALRRRNIVLGQWIKHGGWSPDFQTRLIRADRGYRYVDQIVHQHLPVPRNCLFISNLNLRHDTYRTIDDYWLKLLRHTTHERAQIYSWQYRDNRPGGNILKVLSRKLPARFWIHLVYRYILKAGFLDGRIGWHLALWSAVYQDVLTARKNHENKPTGEKSG